MYWNEGVLMCKYCEGDSSDREIFIEPMSGDWYLRYKIDEDFDDKIFVSFCPYCGRKLTNEEEVNMTAADILSVIQKVFMSKKPDDVNFRIMHGRNGCVNKIVEYIRSRYNV